MSDTVYLKIGGTEFSGELAPDIVTPKTEIINNSERSIDGTMNIINVDANNSLNPSEDKAYESGNTMGHGATQTFYTYSGEIDVMLDAGSNVMIDGIYTGTMYVHVVAEVGAS